MAYGAVCERNLNDLSFPSLELVSFFVLSVVAHRPLLFDISLLPTAQRFPLDHRDIQCTCNPISPCLSNGISSQHPLSQQISEYLYPILINSCLIGLHFFLVDHAFHCFRLFPGTYTLVPLFLPISLPLLVCIKFVPHLPPYPMGRFIFRIINFVCLFCFCLSKILCVHHKASCRNCVALFFKFSIWFHFFLIWKVIGKILFYTYIRIVNSLKKCL